MDGLASMAPFFLDLRNGPDLRQVGHGEDGS